VAGLRRTGLATNNNDGYSQIYIVLQVQTMNELIEKPYPVRGAAERHLCGDVIYERKVIYVENVIYASHAI
jgi:hypothetical protein